MVFFSCCAYAANRSASLVLPGRTDIISAVGAFVIGLLGNIYSRVVRGTAFTSMVTGVLFLVPVSHISISIVREIDLRSSLALPKAAVSLKLIITLRSNIRVDFLLPSG